MSAGARFSALATLATLCCLVATGCPHNSPHSDLTARPDGGLLRAPDGGAPDAGSPEDQATGDTLNTIAKAFATFYADELRWPLKAGDWDPRGDVAGPAAFGMTDTALFTAPSNLPACSDSTRGPCWRGPFISGGTTLGAAPWLDAWDNPIHYALIPTNEADLGVASTPQGTVVLWSTGEDGIDQTGCTAPAGEQPQCTLSLSHLAAGQSSTSPSDDIILVVGPALDPLVFTEKLLNNLSSSYRAFFHDTGVWPFADCGWNPAPMHDQQINGLAYDTLDTVLTTAPNSSCSEVATVSWFGSYLWSDVDTMIDPPMLDGWYHPLMYAYIRPQDGWGGGTTLAPEGGIILWSIGPDGVDQTGCTGGDCELNIGDLATGHSSGVPSDDIIVFVGEAGAKM